MTKTCPRCACEYRWEIVRCADCGETLISTRDYEADPGRYRSAGSTGEFVREEDLLLPADMPELSVLRVAELDVVRELARWLAAEGIPHRIDPWEDPARREHLAAYRGGHGPLRYELRVRTEELVAAGEVDRAYENRDDPNADFHEVDASPDAPLCPACGARVPPDVGECPDCGIPFLAD